MTVVAVEHLTRRYGDFAAVDDVSFEVPAGQLLAVLGPNGAGKTTTLEMLEGFVAPASGTISVLGANPDRAGRAWRARIGRGAAHTQEPGFLWPSYDPYGTELYNLLSPAEQQLSPQMITWWGSFLWRGAPAVPGTPNWPAYSSGELMSLRPPFRAHAGRPTPS